MEEVTVVLPNHVEASVSFCKQLSLVTHNGGNVNAIDSENENSNAGRNDHHLYHNNSDTGCRLMVLKCDFQRPGVVWRGLEPCLLEASKTISKRAVACLWKELGLSYRKMTKLNYDRIEKLLNKTTSTACGDDESLTRRKLILHKPKKNINYSQQFTTTKYKARRRWILWIQPPNSTYFHGTFCSLLVRFEHNMILYQSLAAWFSTLGGGYFFCRHLTTALALARQQQRVALLMGDYTMAYKCVVNQAYDYIYAGKFSMAMQTISSILKRAAKKDVYPPIDPVIIKMCYSAKLFCKRFKKATKILPHNNSNNTSSTSGSQRQACNGLVSPQTVDDYQRIRIVQDQSTRSSRL